MDRDKTAQWKLKVAKKRIKALEAENRTLNLAVTRFQVALNKATDAWYFAEQKLPKGMRTL